MLGKLLRILGVIITTALVVFLYVFKYSGNTTVLRAPSGKYVFGYDKKQARWLFNEFPQNDLGIDGPHIFYNDPYNEIVNVKEGDKGISVKVDKLKSIPDSLLCAIDNTDKNTFIFHIKDKLEKARRFTQCPKSSWLSLISKAILKDLYNCLLAMG